MVTNGEHTYTHAHFDRSLGDGEPAWVPAVVTSDSNRNRKVVMYGGNFTANGHRHGRIEVDPESDVITSYQLPGGGFYPQVIGKIITQYLRLESSAER